MSVTPSAMARSASARAHRRATRDVVGAGREAQTDQPPVERRLGSYTGIDDAYTRARVIREHVDGGPTAEEVRRHLTGHLRGIMQTPRAATPWSPAATTTSRRSSLGVGLSCP